MKKLLVIAVALAAVNAEATRARVTALSNSPHLVDVQTVYANPAHIHAIGGDYLNLETGAQNSTTSTDGAEAMIVRTMGDAKLGLSLGHDSANASTWGLRNTGNGNFGNQQNPIELTYGAKAGDMSWAATLVYSNFQDKRDYAAVPVAGGTNQVEKESSMGLRGGVMASGWEVSLALGLANSAELVNQSNGVQGNKYTGEPTFTLNGEYQMDSVLWFGTLAQNGYKVESDAGTQLEKATTSTITAGAVATMKKDGMEVFYGASLNSSERKETVADTKTSTLTLPVWVGVEAEANSWLTLRGSLSQNLQLVNNSKTTTAGNTTAEFAPNVNNTTIAAGAGLKFNKVTVDGTLQGVNNQQLNANNLLATLGMTYMF